ncbi:hypothetical protein K2173_026607 [Erythroxylum novogranatense]|uniref:DUF7733 domain-containing protein n=1 Tax=Erythroxylum novogranatense TaxID=1862640 RepID=A0AAV8TWT5_9ROSI|nr:hypothetical protein K2173_026607 [Erythroxylum novogranatense]
MSGGVGLTSNDVNVQDETTEQAQKLQEDVTLSKNPRTITTSKKSGFLSFRQLNCLAIIVVLAASGMVSPEDFGFVAFSFIYMYFLSKVAFPYVQNAEDSAVYPKSVGMRIYVFVAAIIGLYLPIAYIFEGIIEGDKEGIKTAAPHVFLLASQVFMEGVAFSGKFATPVFVFVPVFYNSKRIFTIVDWLRNEFSKVEGEYGGSARRLQIGRALAVSNMAFWCYNLFCFLLPVYLPKAFKKYYSKLKD